MEIHISNDVQRILSKAAKNLGFNEEEIVERAVLYYIDTIRKQLDLKSEFEAWDQISDEALINFESNL